MIQLNLVQRFALVERVARGNGNALTFKGFVAPSFPVEIECSKLRTLPFAVCIKLQTPIPEVLEEPPVDTPKNGRPL